MRLGAQAAEFLLFLRPLFCTSAYVRIPGEVGHRFQNEVGHPWRGWQALDRWAGARRSARQE
jgi:hypothetical protein